MKKTDSNKTRYNVNINELFK